MSSQDEATLNIGALSTATGVPVETIRTWERRYGFPESARNEAGHRIYRLDTIEHLRLITAILAEGYRPSQLQGQSREELAELLRRTTGEDENDQAAADEGDEEVCEEWIQEWLAGVTQLNRGQFSSDLRREYNRMDALAFLKCRIGPFLVALGEGWAAGNLSVLHEHFASECIRDFLTATWRPMSEMARGELVILATLSGEQHCLGLHMAALVAALADRSILFIGSSAPVEAIAEAVSNSEAQTVAISISRYADVEASQSFLEQLRQLVGSDVDIVIGGQGASDNMTAGEVVDDLEEFYDFLRLDH